VQSGIVQEMARIGIKHFRFMMNNRKSQQDAVSGTSLMGDDRLNVLVNFDVSLFLERRRAEEVKKLWHTFHEIYIEMRGTQIPTDETIESFQTKLIKWLELFRKTGTGVLNSNEHQERGLYSSEEITPYMHALVNHVPEMMKLLRAKGLRLRHLSCEPVENKNWKHIRYFFSGSRKGGGGVKDGEGSCVLQDMMEVENRRLYYFARDLAKRDNPIRIHMDPFNSS
jgi:hypothetical protein